jgi:hypothetical protein
MPLQATSGAASYDAFGGGVVAEPNYIESVFSTYLYTGNSSTQTITNGIDLSTKGGLVWTKARPAPVGHGLVDTARGGTKLLQSNTTAAEDTFSSYITSFNANGYTLGASGVLNDVYSMVSWTFRKQPKFFDIVTWTGDGTTNRAIPHNLGSTPGCYIVKSTSAATDWIVWHRSLTGNSYNLVLNTTAAQANYGLFSTTAPNSTNIYLGTAYPAYYNDSGQTYVAYLFAHDAGGFGLTGTDNVISCGSFTTAGSGRAVVNLGWEPQFILVKRTNAVEDWRIVDNMRGLGGRDATNWTNTSVQLNPNLSNAENTTDLNIGINPSGFNYEKASSSPYIYIAIRRGPMKVPTSGTSVFAPVASNVSSGTQITAGFPVDMQIYKYRDGTSSNYLVDRLRGVSTTTTVTAQPELLTNTTNAESVSTGTSRNWDNTSFAMPSGFGGINDIFWNFRRAPSFFDVVCWSGNSVARTITHNLAVVPELMIVKSRTRSPAGWYVYNQASGNTKELFLDSTIAIATNDTWNNTTPTSSVFSVDNSPGVNETGNTYVAYLFATCAGVSKVFSYTGNGSSQTINCGFTSGARFVLIKRTNAAGDWYVWDTARGIVSGNDPHLSLNTTAAEVTTDDTIDTDSTGFVVNQVSATNVNVSSATYIGLAIA